MFTNTISINDRIIDGQGNTYVFLATRPGKSWAREYLCRRESDQREMWISEAVMNNTSTLRKVEG